MVNAYSDLYPFSIGYMQLSLARGKNGNTKFIKTRDVIVQSTGVSVPSSKCLVIDYIIHGICEKWVANREIQILVINLLQPTGHVMHHQFNTQQLYVLPTLYLCVLYLSENKQRLVPLTA